MQQVNTCKNKKIHIKIIAGRTESVTDFTAPFKYLIADKTESAKDGQGKVVLYPGACPSAAFFDAGGDEPGSGQ